MDPAPPLEIRSIGGSPELWFGDLRARPYLAWLDSSGGPRDIAGWSFLMAEPIARLESRGGRTFLDAEGKRLETDRDPLEVLRVLLRRFAIPPRPDLPAFIGGAVGWLGYDLVRRWETLSSPSPDETGLPDLRMAFYDTVYAWCHADRRMWRITRRDLDPFVPQEGILFQEREFGGRITPGTETEESPLRVGPPSFAVRGFNEESYGKAFALIQEYIAAGDIYQANLTRRVTRSLESDRADLYLALRRLNPAPFGAYLDFGDVVVSSASPERFLSLDSATRRAETRPIKGTRPRSPDPEIDRKLAGELLGSSKDHAEHLMIVDVHRNDLGKVCDYGSVRTTRLAEIQSFATVHHLVSVIEGRLRLGRDAVDLVKASFPAGSITGAPKRRAMEILAELEPVPRGIYTGAIGYFGWDGSMDLSIAIRTLIVQGDHVHYGVGGGIVADSRVNEEYQETLDKGAALEKALSAARYRTDFHPSPVPDSSGG